MKEESFGPVTGIQKVKDDNEALQLMQDTEYGLTAAVYSQNYERAEALMKQINTGTVYWNCCDRVSGVEAEGLGLVSLTCDESQLKEKALEVARQLAAGPQTALRWSKYS